MLHYLSYDHFRFLLNSFRAGKPDPIVEQERYPDRQSSMLNYSIKLQYGLLEHIRFEHLHHGIGCLSPLPLSQFARMRKPSPSSPYRAYVSLTFRGVFKVGLHTLKVGEQVRVDSLHLGQVHAASAFPLARHYRAVFG